LRCGCGAGFVVNRETKEVKIKDSEPYMIIEQEIACCECRKIFYEKNIHRPQEEIKEGSVLGYLNK